MVIAISQNGVPPGAPQSSQTAVTPKAKWKMRAVGCCVAATVVGCGIYTCRMPNRGSSHRIGHSVRYEMHRMLCCCSYRKHLLYCNLSCCLRKVVFSACCPVLLRVDTSKQK